MRGGLFLRFVLCFFLVGLSSQAKALTISTFTDLSSFQIAAGSLALEDFSGEPNEPLFSKDLGDFSLSLDNSAQPAGGFYGGTFSIFNEQLLLQQCCWWSVTKLTFDTPIAALGFNWSNGDTWDSIELLVDGQSFVFGVPGQQGFFGIVATDGEFSVAGFSDTFGGGGGLTMGLIDNIRYSSGSTSSLVPVPAPPTVWLIVLGLGVFAHLHRRRTIV